MSNSKKKKLKLIPLGGVEDINRNCYVVEYGRDIVVVDMGLSFPDEDDHGIDLFLPDVSYLEKRKDRITGIVISHSHLDHIGAIPMYLKRLGFPKIYAREFTVLFLREKLKEYGLDKKAELIKVDPKKDINLNAFKVQLVPVLHSIPQASGVYVKSPVGSIFYTGDYKFDEKPIKGTSYDEDYLRKISKEGIDLGMMDSTNVYVSGRAISEDEVANNISGIIGAAEGRVIVSTFSSLGSRLHGIFQAAKKHNRKVAITGRSMKLTTSLMKEMGYLDYSSDLTVSEKQINSVKDEDLIILATGSQGERYAALTRVSRGEHSDIKIKETDTVILSSSVIPGNQVSVQYLIDDLLKRGAKVFHQSFVDVHTSGHGHLQDMKKMYNLLKPKNLMPVHGWPSFLHESRYQHKKWGMDEDRILMPKTGQIFEFDSESGTWSKGTKIECEDVYVDGGQIIPDGEKVVKQRRDIAEEGVVVVSFAISKNLSIKGDVLVDWIGLSSEIVGRSLDSQIENNVKSIVGNYRGRGNLSNKLKGDMEYDIQKSVKKLVSKSLGKYPWIFCEIV